MGERSAENAPKSAAIASYPDHPDRATFPWAFARTVTRTAGRASGVAHYPTSARARTRDNHERALPFRGCAGDGRGPTFVGSRASDRLRGETGGKPDAAKQSARARLPETVPRLFVLRLGVGLGL